MARAIPKKVVARKRASAKVVRTKKTVVARKRAVREATGRIKTTASIDFPSTRR